MDQLGRITYVTEYYAQLQSLRLVPLSVPFLVSAQCRIWLDGGPVTGSWSFMALFAVAVLVSYAFRAQYRHRFGDVRALPSRSGAVTLFGCSLALLALVWVQPARSVVSLPILFVAALLPRLAFVADRLRLHYLGISVGCAALAVLPLFEVSLRVREIALDLLVGGGLIVARLGPHHL